MDSFLYLFRHFDWRVGFLPGYRGYLLASVFTGILLKLFWARYTWRLSWARSLKVEAAMNVLLGCSDLLLLPLTAIAWVCLINSLLAAMLGAAATFHILEPRDLVGIVLVYGLFRTLMERAWLGRFGYTQLTWKNLGFHWAANILTVIAGSLGTFAWVYPVKCL